MTVMLQMNAQKFLMVYYCVNKPLVFLLSENCLAFMNCLNTTETEHAWKCRKSFVRMRVVNLFRIKTDVYLLYCIS